MYFDVPTQINKKLKSKKQIYEIYKNELTPIKINFHKKNGTI